ncbi:PREDICTED: phosphoinositide phospholipase C 2-like [Nicotiana attenuata]|uniref:Phosphoinositide phospholipase C n=1 Tax=Nicotiana attenuata TaxID=49451 RepID=A0A1J6I0M6_NICAT|nr:PREDICTED: phosphoinositide phospholipase C 2-like [Nicotiana attenuata]OIS98097.1 phosphoinositide phospholipase c 2 [Nicotiana attenuata]
MSKQTYRICCFQRKFKMKEAEPPNEIKDLFNRYSENGIMTAEHLYRFLNDVQGEDKVTKEEAESVLESVLKLVHEHLNIVFHRKGLNLDGFFRYLFSDANASLSPDKEVHHDMTAPLSHYFIYTSHNTYLTGNQLNSDCSDVPIIKALQRGVRVIELDMWPNSSKDNVDILHGGTLTPPVELIRCLKSIKEHAFVASEYPVILTLEDHLTPNLQAKVAEMVTQIFGDMLFTCGAECLSEFPSPESLKGRVIISTKPPKEYLETKKPNEKDNGSQKGKKSSEEKAWGAEISDLSQKLIALYENKENGECQDEEPDSIHENPNIQQNTAPEYKHLIAIQGAKSKGPTSEWLTIDPIKVKRISLNEEKLTNVALKHGKELIRFTQRNLVRVYPKGIRVDSSNYNPLIGWMHGAQMVAFNMQGNGRPLWLMQGMFRANGGCGYVRKPELLLKSGPNNEVHDPKRLLSVKTTLKVKIYMGRGWHLDFKRTHFDIYSPPDFYVKIGIAGVPADSGVKKTRPIEDDWVPTWNDEFEFPLTVPEIALLRVEVHEYDMSEIDDFGGQTCIPVSELGTGIRAVPLYNEKGEKYPSVKLLMRFEFVK